MEPSFNAASLVKVTRYGAYGVLCREGQLLVTLKRSGPFKGRWDLPGGAIEFGESPEEALQREFLEEAALTVTPAELLGVVTFNGHYQKNGEPHLFHHVGVIYKVTESSLPSNKIPEEELLWIHLRDIDPDQLTPFARHAVKQLNAVL